MAAALRLGGEEGFHYALRKLYAHYALAYGKHIGVVMLPAKAGHNGVGAECAAHSLYFVCGYGYADARAANHYTSVSLSFYHSLAAGNTVIRVVRSIRAVAAKVDYLVSKGFNVFLQLFLKVKAAVIGRNCNFHFILSSLRISFVGISWV